MEIIAGQTGTIRFPYFEWALLPTNHAEILWRANRAVSISNPETQQIHLCRHGNLIWVLLNGRGVPSVQPWKYLTNPLFCVLQSMNNSKGFSKCIRSRNRTPDHVRLMKSREMDRTQRLRTFAEKAVCCGGFCCSLDRVYQSLFSAPMLALNTPNNVQKWADVVTRWSQRAETHSGQKIMNMRSKRQESFLFFDVDKVIAAS